MAKKQEVLIDKDGRKIPVEYIDPNIIDRHKLVEDLYQESLKMRLMIKNFKQRTRELVKKYLITIAEQHGEKWKGNTAILDFSGNIKIDIGVSEVLEFDEKLQIAKQKIDKCINEWSGGSSKEIVVLIQDAFKVDKKGKLDTSKILGLRRHKFDGSLWKDAMELIADSITVSNTKKYINFYKRINEDEWQLIQLNWSKY
jgi:Protein of unknown function (DUF3164)